MSGFLPPGLAAATPMLLAGAAMALGLVVLCLVVVMIVRCRRPPKLTERELGHQVLHTASLLATALRGGLTQATAQRALPYVATLLGGEAVALADRDGVLAWYGTGESEHATAVASLCAAAATHNRTKTAKLSCPDRRCPLTAAVAVPLERSGRTVGALVVGVSAQLNDGLTLAVEEAARWISAQLGFADADRQAKALARAEVRALRAQISPHFVYNALSAIASFVRTDPDRARELIEEFAEFTRYSFRSHGDFTTLAEELRSIDRYLLIERARFGRRLQVRMQVAPQVLGVAVPFLCLQPLVENAIRHGLSAKRGIGTITIIASDDGTDCLLSVEDDGVGMNAAELDLPDTSGDIGDHVGMANVDIRLRSMYGDGYGLRIDTALGVGTRVSMRVPRGQL
ncbi:sensor histidine kinase [Fodinicola acaciae]|uniref:sensor histidine kinase n=1 Tax=Fodinicola acaciae TaxID=2681555 RepID=UPI001FE73CDC|nr:histidine kinase [Fodinicola acaciae]